MVLITQAHWDLVEEEADVEDENAAELLEPVSADDVFIRVSDVSRFNDEDLMRLGEERLRIKEIPTVDDNAKDKSGLIQVERGILGTVAEEHTEDTTIYNFPKAPDEPTVLQSSCGQTAQAPAPQGTPGLIEPFEGQTVEISAANVAFNTRELTVNTGGQVRIRFTNNEAVDHNIAVYQSATTNTPVSPGSVGVIFQGPNVTDDTVFAVPAAGTYSFRCDVHPTLMVGDFIVR
jgi:plastocyanin